MIALRKIENHVRVSMQSVVVRLVPGEEALASHRAEIVETHSTQSTPTDSTDVQHQPSSDLCRKYANLDN